MGRREQERVAETVGVAMGAATGATAFSVFAGFDADPKGPTWLGLVLFGAIALVLLVVPSLRRDARVQVLGIGFLPFALVSAVVNALEVDDPLGRTIRASAFLVSVAALFAIGVTYSRRKREVDQLIFREASLFAFFATMIAAVIYGTIAQVADVPDIKYSALAVFGMGAWTLALFVFDRRYS